jgi:hypothetical protein
VFPEGSLSGVKLVAGEGFDRYPPQKIGQFQFGTVAV